jgi:phosphoribosyl 1,2-cyclic phosphodiesterase
VHFQVLSSGSGGNASLIRVGGAHVLIDAGLSPRAMGERFEAARLPFKALDHILVTHGHLDHSRSSGILAKKHEALVHCPEKIMKNKALRRAQRFQTIAIGRDTELEGTGGMRYRPVLLPHDCDPTVAYRFEFAGRVAVILTDMGEPRDEVAAELQGAHVLLLEFNHDSEMLANGPYGDSLRARVGGNRGHLSNEQAAQMLTKLAGPELHTVILAHLSCRNNTSGHALRAARTALAHIGREDVDILVASQDEIGPNLEV